jgi:hypothetical protein
LFASSTLSSSKPVSSSSYSPPLLLLHIVLAQVSMLLPNKRYCALSLSGEPAAAEWSHWCWWRVGGRSSHFVRIVSGFGLPPPFRGAATLPGPLYAVPGASCTSLARDPEAAPHSMAVEGQRGPRRSALEGAIVAFRFSSGGAEAARGLGYLPPIFPSPQQGEPSRLRSRQQRFAMP